MTSAASAMPRVTHALACPCSCALFYMFDQIPRHPHASLLVSPSPFNKNVGYKDAGIQTHLFVADQIVRPSHTMSLQVCPHCEKLAFTWFVDEERSKFTFWVCNECGYEPEEDESREMVCQHCGQLHGSSLLRDKEGFHRWCCRCHRFEPTHETF